MDSFDLTYPRFYAAIGSALALRGDGPRVVTVDGFAEQAVVVFDVTRPRDAAPGLAAATSRAAGNYRVSFAPAGPRRTYFAATPAGWRAPTWTKAACPRRLRPQRGAPTT